MKDVIVKFQFEDGLLVEANHVAETYDSEDGEHLASRIIANDIGDYTPDAQVNYTETPAHECRGNIADLSVACQVQPLATPLMGVACDELVTVYALITV